MPQGGGRQGGHEKHQEAKHRSGSQGGLRVPCSPASQWGRELKLTPDWHKLLCTNVLYEWFKILSSNLPYLCHRNLGITSTIAPPTSDSKIKKKKTLVPQMGAPSSMQRSQPPDAEDRGILCAWALNVTLGHWLNQPMALASRDTLRLWQAPCHPPIWYPPFRKFTSTTHKHIS